MKERIKIKFVRLNHIQICIPLNKEEEAREFYCGLLGLKEIQKPDDLKENGGFWLEIGDVELHIGVEDLNNQSKRHPAFEVVGLQSIKDYLLSNGTEIKEDNPLPLFNRFSFYDPFNNRIELLEPKFGDSQ